MKIYYFITLSVIFLYACDKPQKTSNSMDSSWPTSTFEVEDMSKVPIDSLIANVKVGTYGNVDELVILKNGKLVLNQTFTNDYKQISAGITNELGCGYDTCEDSTVYGDYNYLHPYWHPYYHQKKVHTLQSITKSISSLMIGLAIDQGHIASTSVKLIDYLQDYDLSTVDELFRMATLEDLLTMRLGMEWYEIGAPLSNNTTEQLEKSEDWIQFTLDQAMDTIPGTTWVYNSGASQLMSVIIKKATGYALDDYAKKYLFDPLQITDFHWKHTPKGLPDALGGLYLKAEDLAKIGYMVLNHGEWNGEQVISKEWIKRSTTRISDSSKIGDYGYGYQWWRPDTGKKEVWAGFGFGGQYVLIFPQFNTVAVIYCWNIFEEEVEDLRSAIIEVIIKANK